MFSLRRGYPPRRMKYSLRPSADEYPRRTIVVVFLFSLFPWKNDGIVSPLQAKPIEAVLSGTEELWYKSALPFMVKRVLWSDALTFVPFPNPDEAQRSGFGWSGGAAE